MEPSTNVDGDRVELLGLNFHDAVASMEPSTNVDGDCPTRASSTRRSSSFNGAVDERRRRPNAA